MMTDDVDDLDNVTDVSVDGLGNVMNVRLMIDGRCLIGNEIPLCGV